MYTISTAAAAVTGARHLRVARNGQDAVATWTGEDCGAVVVCDGCSSGAFSELGARLGSQLAIRLIGEALMGDRPAREIWTSVRAKLGAELERVVEAMPGARERVVHDHFLFTIIAAAWQGDEVAVWALGDGGYAIGERVVELGPFPDNQPPYLGYDLLGDPQPAHLEVADAACGSVTVATDGVLEVGLAGLVEPRCFDHPDALRRKLAVLAKGTERIDWEARRIVRVPARLQDDGALAVLAWSLVKGLPS
jgi:hypothetical protein